MNTLFRRSALGLVLLGGGALGAAAMPPATTPAGPDAPAAALVERLNPKSSLYELAGRVARSTVTYGVLVRRLGAAEAERRVRQSLSRTLPKYQARWNTNLASVYARRFSAAELQSLTALGPRSPFAAKFTAGQDSVAADMRRLSSPLLTQMVTEALVAATSERV